MAEKLRERRLALAADDHIDPPVAQGLVDRVCEVGPPGYDDARRIEALDQLRGPQGLVGGDRLLADSQDIDPLGGEASGKGTPAELITRRVPHVYPKVRQMLSGVGGKAQQPQRLPERRGLAVERPDVSRRTKQHDSHDGLPARGSALMLTSEK